MSSHLFDLVKVVLLTAFYIIYYIVINIFNKCFGGKLKPVKGEIVLITGGGQGIGRELAFSYAREGAIVIICDIDAVAGKNVVQELKELGYTAHFFICDVSKYDDVLSLSEEIKGKIGNVTILINNAGVATANWLHVLEKTEIDRVINVNLMSHFWTIHVFLPTMIQNKKGHIVEISSMSGMIGLPNGVVYSASKFAVRGMMQGLYQENRLNKTNVQFTTILPYFVDTKLIDINTIKLPDFMPPLKTKTVAEKILEAQRKNLREVAVPNSLLYLLKIKEFFPQEAIDPLFDLYQMQKL